MWDDLLRVDWSRLTHAYGWAKGVPKILIDMVSRDAERREEGWGHFWGSVNHQGDFYDSTVAAIPFLVEAVSYPQVSERARILEYFRDRWVDAPEYGGDGFLDEPPGGLDPPTPMLTDAEFALADVPTLADAEDPDDDSDEDFDTDSYRPMDLCAWQAARAIRAGLPVFERLLEDPDRGVASASAALLLLWPDTRVAGKQALARVIEEGSDPVEQARQILEFGIYGCAEDFATFEEWVAWSRPGAVRAAAALAWAWVVNPGPLPAPAAVALAETSLVDSDAFGRLPWAGLWHRGPWILPANAADLILRLAGNRDDELRWRAVQGLAIGRETAKHLAARRVVAVLIERLPDRYDRVREAAALALSQRGESILEVGRGAVPALIQSLDDVSPSVCGHAARLLVAMSNRLEPAERAQAVGGIDRAVRRVGTKQEHYVQFDSMGVPAGPFLKEQRRRLQEPSELGLPDLFEESAFPTRQDSRLSATETDRRLADAYANAPRETIAAAIEAVGDSKRRNTAIGAARWLMTLGPAAEPALRALDAMERGELDAYAQEQAQTAGKFIRESLLVASERDWDEVLRPDESSSPGRMASLIGQVKEGLPSSADIASLLPNLIDSLAHPDPYVRARWVWLFAKLLPTVVLVRRAAPSLLGLLSDEVVAEVGIVGRFEFDGRIYHWRRERLSPRAGAIHVLLQVGQIPEGDLILRAMIGESTRAAFVCAGGGSPHVYDIAHWRSVAEAAGGVSIAEPVIRAARQRCRAEAWSTANTDNTALASVAHLAEVIRQLSGRLV